MNQILLFEQDFISENRARLAGRRLEHLNGILGSQRGDSLRAGILNGRQGLAEVLSISAGEALLETRLDKDPPQPLPLTLVMAVQRPKTMKKVFQCAAAAGVKTIYLMRTWRVEKSYFESPVLTTEAIRENLILGLEQACDTMLPSVEIRSLFKPFAEDELPEIIQNTAALAAHPTAGRECPRSVTGAVTLAMGPEGGFIPFEIEKLASIGFLPVSIGPRILRTEFALPSLIGRLF